MRPRYLADDLIDTLRKTYADREWVLIPQVANGTGAGAGRTADAIAMNCWPSRGLELHGFEVKTYRGDWLRELKQPEKAEAIFQYCDRWWIVTPAGESVIFAEDVLPPTWGLVKVELQTGKLEIAKDAPKLKPKALDRAFVAAVLRGLAKVETPEAKIAAAIADARQAGIDEGRSVERLHARHASDYDRARDQLSALRYLEKSALSVLKGIQSDLAVLKPLAEHADSRDIVEHIVTSSSNTAETRSA